MLSKSYTIPLIIILAIFSVNSYGQERQIRKLTPEKRHKVGETMISSGSYYKAVDHMTELHKEHPGNKLYILKLAEAYFFSRDYKNAEIWYKKLVDLDADKISSALFRYAECLKYNEKYKEAKDAFQKFSTSKYNDRKGENFKLLARNEVSSCQFAIDNLEKIQPFEIIHLGDNVNSKYSEFAPCLWSDSTLVFSSLQSDSVLTVKPDEAHPHQVKLYSSPLQQNQWGPHSTVGNLNTTFENNANAAISPDGKRFYFTRCVQDENEKMVCNIYVSQIENGIPGKPKKLPARINRRGFTATQPYVTRGMAGKKKADILYFVSDRPGGKGGLDIWYTIADEKGYSGAVNAGKEINTIRDEITPYYDTITNTLFFSSNYHYGFGGFDVFSCKGELNRYNRPVNIGKPVNSRVDDTYFTIRGKKRTGFVVSNRPEGYHLTSETCCDDIYSHQLTKNILIAKLTAYNNKDQRIQLKEIPVRLFEKTPSSETSPLQLYRQGDKLPGDSVNVLTEDSANSLNRKSIRTYFKTGNPELRTATQNTVIPANTHPLFPEADNSYLLQPGKEYLAAAAFGKDTIVYLVSTDAGLNIKDSVSQGEKTGEASFNDLEDFKLVNINLFFNKAKDSIPVTTAKTEKSTPDQSIENERSNTVTRVFKELESEHSKDLKIILNYDFDDTKFIEKHSGSLDSLVTILKKYPKLNIFIGAHTDSKGSDNYNINLSKKRVKSIVDYMSSKGISKKRMSGQGYGETIPLVPNENPDGSDSPENRWLNRRAEITILDE
jgi:outer membrane protein OmpA-like peptidoglycan-associated protein